MLKWIAFLLFLAFAVGEVAALLEIGGRIGALWTVVAIIATALLGIAMVRVAGLHALTRIHARLREQVLPTQELMDMAMILAAGVLMILPGFLSDALGVLLLLPPVRWMVRGCLCAAYGSALPTPYPPDRGAPTSDDVIEIRPHD